ncbi:MAG: hypothetical protein GY839_09185 [candidate division Zixibacteria bacterium]|nr:hypothetical protein [candidate division Zixibacteria bacterium]
MRKVLVLALLILITGALQASEENQFIYKSDYIHLKNSTVTHSNDVSTALNFQLGGIELTEPDIARSGYVKPEPMAENPEMFGRTHEEGMPDLPLYSDAIIIPDQAGVRVNIISVEYETIQNVDIVPTQPFKIEGNEDPLPFAKNNEAYSRDEFYPGDIVSVGEPMIMRDFRFIQTVVYPTQYNPVTKELRVYTHVDYELIYEGIDTRNVKVRNNNQISEAFVPMYRSVFNNAEDVLTDFDVIKGGFLIITEDSYGFPTLLETLATWKHQKGYYTHIAPSTEITPSGAPSYAQVKSYIQDAYDTWETPPDYVLIVGDENMDIPNYPYSGYTSDHQYTTVDGSDYISDVLIARMAADDANELLTAMEKVLRYEQDPDMTDPDYYTRGLGVAGNCCGTPTPTTPRITNLWVRHQALLNGYSHVDTVFSWGDVPPNDYLIDDAIQDGVSYVSYRGWAGSSGWYYPSWGTGDISALNNGFKMGIMASVVCGTGNFGADDCLGEAWTLYGSTTVPDGGPSFYGCTDGSTHTAWNNPNMIGFFWALFEQDMYHFSQLVFMGKQRVFECFPRYTSSGNYVNKYFNTYNALGDPSLEVRTDTPQTMAASYPSSIPVGTNNLTVSVTSGGFPLEGAYVNLVKGHDASEEIFVGDWTDAGGSVTLNFTNTVADTIYVTVTARDYIPHRGHCLSTSATVTVGIESHQLDDDDFAGSNGNSDGRANPNEILGLDINLRNFGDMAPATGITVTLSSSDSRINFANPLIAYPDLQPGGSALPDEQFIVELTDNIPHGEHILIDALIESNEGSWNAMIDLEVKSIKPISFVSSYPGQADDRLDPGDLVTDFVVSFSNAGQLNGQQITGVLSCEDDYITILNGTSLFGDIDIGQSGDNSFNPFMVSVSEDANNGRNVNFTVSFTSNMFDMRSVSFEKTFSIVLGTREVFDPVGPDNYGYYMYDDTDLGYDAAPTYGWIEINPNLGGSGTRVTMPDDDDSSTPITLPFDFVYYGEAHREIIVSTNGFAALDTIPYDVGGNYWHTWDNWPIPDPGNARGQISPFWDDIKSTGSTNGIYTKNDVGGGKFIIEWSGFTHSVTGSPQTFQMIICNPAYFPTPTGDCEIIFQYNVINNDDDDTNPNGPATYSSVGFENWDQNDGLQYEYDNTYHGNAAVLQSGRAIKITTATGTAPPPDMAYSPSVFNLACDPGAEDEDDLTIENNGEGLLSYSISAEVIDGGVLRSVPVKVSSRSQIDLTPESNIKTEDFSGPYNPPVILDSGGPDAFGYTWRDSNEPGGPVYSWKDISSIGTEITGMGDESSQGPFPIGFSFNFYGTDFTTFRATSNGFVSFTSTNYPYDNGPIPTAAEPNNMLAVYWDDLNFNSGGNAYYYNNGSDSCIISYEGVPHYSAEGSFTFQIILLASGKIVYQYQEATGEDVNQETIGIENGDGTDGLMVCYDQAYVVSGLAIEFAAFPIWLSTDPASNIVDPYSTEIVTVTADAADLDEGLYEGILHMSSNDLDYPSVEIPVHFTVSSSTLQSPSLISPPNGDESIDLTPTLTWSDVSEATVYHLQVDDNSNFSSPVYENASLTGQSYTFPSNLATGQYYWHVRCSDGEQWSVYSSTWNFTLATLQSPTLVSPPNDDISDDLTPTLTWAEVTEATIYQLQVDDNSDFSSPVYDNASLAGESYTFPSALGTGQYYWHVRCSDGEQWSNYSSSWNFILSILEEPVTEYPGDGESIFDSEPTFVWHQATGAIRYHIQIDDASSFTSPIYNNSNVTDTTYLVSSPLSSGTFYWHIRAFDGIVWSDYTATWDFSASVPEVPQLTSPPNGNESSTDPPTFAWQTADGATSYTIQVDNNSDFSSPIIDIGGLSTNSFTPAAPLGEDTYYWHISAEGDFGNSSFSASFSFTINYGSTSLEYLPGDVNMANGAWPPMVIGGDVTFLVNYFRGMPSSEPCPLSGFWCSSDANGDCLVIGSDVTKLVNYFRGTTGLSWCGDYEPQWHEPGELPPDAPAGWPNCETVTTGKDITGGMLDK